MSKDKLRPLMKAVADLPAHQTGLALDVVKHLSEDDSTDFVYELGCAVQAVRDKREQRCLRIMSYIHAPKELRIASELELRRFTFHSYMDSRTTLHEPFLTMMSEAAHMAGRAVRTRLTSLKKTRPMMGELKRALERDGGAFFSNLQLLRAVVATMVIAPPVAGQHPYLPHGKTRIAITLHGTPCFLVIQWGKSSMMYVEGFDAQVEEGDWFITCLR